MGASSSCWSGICCCPALVGTQSATVTKSMGPQVDAPKRSGMASIDVPMLISPPPVGFAEGSRRTSKRADWDSRTPGAFLVGIAGGTACGKTTITHELKKHLEALWGPDTVAAMSMDSFYKGLTTEQLKDVSSYNFDHPDAFAWHEALDCLRSLRMGGCVSVPTYDFAEHRRFPVERSSAYDGARLRVIIVEGILLFYKAEIRNLFDLRIFVDVASDTRLCRRVRRDVKERNRNIKAVLNQYQSTVKPSFEAFCNPTKKYADIIMPRGIENERGMQTIIDAVQRNAPPLKGVMLLRKDEVD
mmetsp:Transcript_97232/g.208571  ORF Transcript_97232/g.208571 Transcript_97232/m.208571 type:complete len:301 (+) Transcript_97232:107-1009(+)